MSESYDWSQFKVHMYYRAPLEDVVAAWSTPGGLESFFIADADHRAPDGAQRTKDELCVGGDRYLWKFLHGIELEGEVLACEPSRSVAYTFGPDMRVDIAFQELDGAVEVALHQSGCATEDPKRAWQHLNCRSCWVYFMTNLKSVLEHGIDLRDHDEPQTNDSVSIGWNA
ncbi:MAG: SRPBCC family protein [Planctomycetota bacterium]